jgi:hypothetical protein
MVTKSIECDFGSDVKNLTVSRASPNPTASVRVLLRVIESDANPNIEADAVPLITAQLLPSQAIRLARALLNTVGAGSKVGNVETFIFID